MTQKSIVVGLHGLFMIGNNGGIEAGTVTRQSKTGDYSELNSRWHRTESLSFIEELQPPVEAEHDDAKKAVKEPHRR